MATDTSEPIVIGSDDESDNDDVVLIKEEIEVDSEDVIFLSETKATPKSDVEASHLSKKTEIPSSESKTSLSSCISLTTGTGQLSLEDSDDNDILDNILAGSATSTVGPLDLSSKSTDSREKDSNSATQGNTDSGIQNAVDGSNSDSSFMMLLTGPEPILQTSVGHSLEVKSERSTNCPSQGVIKGAVNGANDTDNVVGGSCGLNVDNSHSSDQTNLGTPLCDNSLSNNSSASADADWSAFNLLPSRRTTSTNQQADKNSSDPSVGVAALGCIVNTCKDGDKSVIVNTGHGMPTSSNQTGQQKVTEAGNQSVITSQLVTAGQALKNTNSSDSDTKSCHVIANNPRSVTMDTQGTSVDLSDPFQASHALLASLDITLNPSTRSQTGSVNQTDQSSSNTGTQSICPTQGAVNVGQPANFTNGLLGGSIQCIQPTGSQSLSTAMNNDTSSTSSVFKRSLSMMDTNTPYYNSLTLPLSQQNKTYRRSVSSGSFVSYKNALASNPTDILSQSPRSPSPQNPHHLPPKKQKRYYSDATVDFNCTNCELNLTGQKSSRCPNGHSTCTKCLEERVKLVLTGRAKESVKCLNNSCDSYYPISELRHSLPAMVVEILEDKLDQDYVDYITDMIMKKASEEIDQENGSADLDQTEDGRFFKKYEDCPGNWDPMDERDVNRDGYVLVPLETESADYQHVVLRFFESMVDHSVEVTSVYRVQNPIQWKYYMVKKSEMLRDSGGFYSVEEGQLFHGTSSSSVEAICRKGFDWRLCGKHGTLYGQGSYFAVNASYSHQYTDLRRPHGALRSSVSFAPSQSMTLPTAPSLMFPPMNVNFGQPLHPVASPVGISVIQTTQYRPMNLSHNAAASQQVGVCITQTGQPAQLGSSQTLSNSSQSGSTQFGSSTNGSLTNLAQPGPSGSTGTSNSTSFMQSIHGLPSKDLITQKRLSLHARRKHARFCSRKLLPKPLAVRKVPGLTSTGLGTNFDVQQEVERPKAKVFFARVLVGKYTVGNPKLRKPPPLYPNSDQFGKCFDSCVDNVTDPKIFVIFDSTQAYPEYLLEYTYNVDKPF